MTLPEISGRARRRLVWVVPAVVAAVVVLLAVLTGPSSASTPNLPKTSAKALIVAVQRSTTTAFSGTVEETTNLGLPSLPGDARSASLSWTTFLSGTHSVRVWADGPDRQRLALVGELSEAEVVHNGRDLWTYTSHSNTASHTVLPAKSRDSAPAGTADPTPSAIADRLLAAITPSTEVRVAKTTTVAGRAAYVLSLAPRDGRSTVRKATIAIDAHRFVPLRVQIFGSGSAPALSVGFSDVSFNRPAADVFAFRVPKGAVIEKNPLTDARHEGYHHHFAGRSRTPDTAGPPSHAKPAVIGSGWTSVLEVHDLPGLGGGILQDATTSVGGGVRLLHTALLNVVFLPDGRAFIGAVRPAALEHIAATTPR